MNPNVTQLFITNIKQNEERQPTRQNKKTSTYSFRVYMTRSILRLQYKIHQQKNISSGEAYLLGGNCQNNGRKRNFYDAK